MSHATDVRLVELIDVPAGTEIGVAHGVGIDVLACGGARIWEATETTFEVVSMLQ